MRPFACGLLAQMMSMFRASSVRPNGGAVETRKLSDLLVRLSDSPSPFGGRILDYVERAAAEWGAKNFKLADVDVPVDCEQIRGAVEATLGEVFDNIAEAVHHFDCDVVLLSGRPSRLP